MAIKVNGTTVIDDSRNLVNIASGAGSSTTYGDVGTYVTAFFASYGVAVLGGATIAGSSLKMADDPPEATPFLETTSQSYQYSTAGLSGTWRQMSPKARFGSAGNNNQNVNSLFVRIS
jgi:hypothetical protein